MTDKQDYERVVQVKEKNKKAFQSYPNVVSVGVGKKNDTDKLCISVGVKEKVPESELDSIDVIPSDMEGVKTDVVELGEIVPELLLAQADRKGSHRPVPQGVSVGHPDITAGSTGWMYETDTGKVFIGSNNHVLADINQASMGDDIIQPGSADGGIIPDHVIGNLVYYTPLENGVTVDLALTSVDVGHDNALVGIEKKITGKAESLSVGDELVKSGRTTGVMRADIQQLKASVDVNYGEVGTITIEDCIITGDMSDGGDSGSSTAKEVDGGLKAAGRVFAGSSTATVHHHIDNEIGVLQAEFDSSIELITDGGTQMPTAQVTLTLTKEDPQTGNIEATVNSEDGGPVPSATVSIEGPVTRSNPTGTDGKAVFSGVPLGDYTVSADKDGYGTDSTTIEAGQFN